jgi:hypothetical protein
MLLMGLLGSYLSYTCLFGEHQAIGQARPDMFQQWTRMMCFDERCRLISRVWD